MAGVVAPRRLLEPASMMGDLPRLLEPLLPDDGDGMTPSARRMRRLAGVKRALGLRERFVAGLNGLADDDGVPSGVRKYARGSGCKGRRLLPMVAIAGALVGVRVVFVFVRWWSWFEAKKARSVTEQNACLSHM